MGSSIVKPWGTFKHWWSVKGEVCIGALLPIAGMGHCPQKIFANQLMLQCTFEHTLGTLPLNFSHFFTN